MAEKSHYNYRVEPQDVDFTLRATIPSLGGSILNTAGIDAHGKGFGVDALNADNHSWVLSRMAVEKRLKSPLGLVRRADIVVYDRRTRPDIIVECKAPSVPVTQETMDQVVRYNGVLGARILCLTNGLRHVYALPYPEGKGFVYLRELPDYRDDVQE